MSSLQLLYIQNKKRTTSIIHRYLKNLKTLWLRTQKTLGLVTYIKKRIWCSECLGFEGTTWLCAKSKKHKAQLLRGGKFNWGIHFFHHGEGNYIRSLMYKGWHLQRRDQLACVSHKITHLPQ